MLTLTIHSSSNFELNKFWILRIKIVDEAHVLLRGNCCSFYLFSWLCKRFQYFQYDWFGKICISWLNISSVTLKCSSTFSFDFYWVFVLVSSRLICTMWEFVNIFSVFEALSESMYIMQDANKMNNTNSCKKIFKTCAHRRYQKLHLNVLYDFFLFFTGKLKKKQLLKNTLHAKTMFHLCSCAIYIITSHAGQTTLVSG